MSHIIIRLPTALCIDVYSGYVMPQLVKSTAKAVTIVKIFVQNCELFEHPVETACGDQGILSNSMFHVCTPEVESYMLEKHIHSVRAEANFHLNGVTQYREGGSECDFETQTFL